MTTAHTADPLGIAGLEAPEEVGRGGFGVVYRARQTTMSRDVAVKILPAMEGESARRFAGECRAAGAVSDHPHIVSVYDAGETADGRPYLVMAHMAGGSLARHVAAEGPMPWPDAVAMTVKLAGALETAHRAGILHRDIKPGNVLLSADGEPSLCDFGIARVRGASETATGAVTGTVEHAAPEVLGGSRSSTRSDVYSLASTLFMALTGSAPFHREGDESLVPLTMRILHDAVPDLREEGLPEPVASVLERALAKEPAERFATAEEFGEALRAAQAESGLDVTPIVVHGDADGALGLGGLAGEDGESTEPGEGATRHRMRPVSVAATPPRGAVAAPRRKGRNAAVVAAALLAVIALTAGGLALMTRGEERVATADGASATDPTEITLDLGLVQARASGLQVRRVWTLSGDGGSQFSSKVTLANPGTEPVPHHDEVIPKDIAASVLDLDFEPMFSEVIQADPIVRYAIDLAAAGTFTFEYRAKVAADGVSEDRLRRFARAQVIAQNVYDQVPEDTAVEVLEEGTVTVVGAPEGGSSGGTSGGDSGTPTTTPLRRDDPIYVIDDPAPTPTASPVSGGGDSGGGGSASGDTTSSPTTTTTKPDPGAPPTPTGVACQAAQRQITISWNASSGAATYRVYRYGDVSPIAERTTTSYTHTGLNPGQQYSYQVSAVSPTGKESGRGSCSATVPLPPPLAAPAQVAATGGQVQQIPLSWSGVPGAAKYRVYVANGGLVKDDVFDTGYTVGGAWLTCSTHSFQVTTVDQWGQESARSAIATATTGQRGGPTAQNASITIKNNTTITVYLATHNKVSDPDQSYDAYLNHVRVNTNFDHTKFSFEWSNEGWFKIKAPAGFTDARYVDFYVKDRCGAQTGTVRINMQFFTAA